MNNVLVTGANGFVGHFVCLALAKAKFHVRAAVRTAQSTTDVLASSTEICVVGNIDENTAWQDAIKDIDSVVHLAARVHVMNDDCLEAYRQVNVAGTLHLARLAVQAGVKRFVYVSSIKVNGEKTEHNQAFTEHDVPKPEDPYGQSKWEAELALRGIAKETGLEIVILRPTLVYGPGVRANFLKLMQLVDKGYPLPFGTVNNSRSMLYVENLADAILQVLQHAKAAGQTYLLADSRSLSTKELILHLVEHLGSKTKLIHFPHSILQMLAKIVGKSEMLNRLLDSLAVDNSKIIKELNWQPPYSIENGLQKTATWYRASHG